jgi:hypothetical protein
MLPATHAGHLRMTVIRPHGTGTIPTARHAAATVVLVVVTTRAHFCATMAIGHATPGGRIARGRRAAHATLLQRRPAATPR